jgi:phospholipid transport system substrate-binding protein
MRQPHTLRILVTALVMCFGLGLGANSLAATDSPKALLEDTAQKMLDAINNNRDKIKGDPKLTEELIEKNLLPHIDFITASKWVLGQYWDTASKAQKIEFIKTFRTLLLRFYSSALTEYLNTHDEKLDMSLMTCQDPGPAENGQVTVRSEVKPKTGKPVPINYQMHKTRRGWKVYDVSVEGVSVITTYKTSFSSEIQQKGLDGLIASLKERNAKLLAGDNSALKVNNKQ